MEVIYATLKDGMQVEYKGTDLSAKWEEISNSRDYQSGDYYVPSKRKPSKKTLKSYFGNIETTLPL